MAKGKNTKKKTDDTLEESDDPASKQAKKKQSKAEKPDEVDKKVPGGEHDLGGPYPTDPDGNDPTAGDNEGKKGASPVSKNPENKTKPSDASNQVPDKNTMIKQEEKEIEVDVTEDVEALLSGEDLSEEYKEKASNIFEAAVKAKVTEERDAIADRFEARLEEELDSRKDDLVEKLDSYLNYVVEEWVKENEVALEKGIKGEIVEEFLSGLKGLFEQSYIEVPEDKHDVLEEITEERDELEKKLDEAVNKRSELEKQLAESKRKEIVAEFTDDLTESQAEKIFRLSESIDFHNEDKFRANVKLFRENYFPVNGGSSEGEEELLKEEQETEEPTGPRSKTSSVIEQAEEFINRTA